ncbi:MAG: hypothetical protein DI566_14670 [Microbacterium sp.]|nr:MAG: hypothetical protein DI566_14670 [Microbacterium sp.]
MSQSNIGGPSPFWQQYAYDSVGNRTQKIVRTAAGATTTVNTFGGVGSGPHRRVQTQTTSPSGAVVTNGFSFDGAGNQTSTMVGADQKTLGWDAEGELVSVSGGSTAESSVYDASGNRLIRTDGAGSTVFLPGGMEVKVTPANVVSATRWYTFGGRTVAYRNASGVAAMVVVIPDHQGTPAGTVAQSNWAAGVTRTRTDPFGAARSTATGTNGRGFLAATVDTTGLVALGARYYDPDAGRFVSVDPVLSPLNTAQFNAYDYAGNNPVTWSDPSGMDFWSDLGKNVSNAWNTAGKWVKENASTLVGIAAGSLVTAGCLAITAGADSVGCLVAGGAIGGAVTNLYKTTVEKQEFSLGSFVSDVAWGGAAGLLGPVAGAIGKALAPTAKTLVASLSKPVQALINKATGALRAPTPKSMPAASSGRAGPVSTPPAGPPSGATCAFNSFTAGTLILLADGTTTPIEQVTLGDRVAATDPETGATASEPVVAVIHGTGMKDLVSLTVTGEDGTTGVVEATEGHPIWTTRGWLIAGDLAPGDWLRTSAGTWVQLTAVQYDHREQTVYNLTINTTHTYYVYAGTTNILTHNCGVSAQEDWANVSGILRDAARGKGSFGLGDGVVAEAQSAGKAWVGEGARLSRDGKAWVSADGLRQWRPPTYKQNWNGGTWQSNFESRWVPNGEWQTNGHLDITDLP